MSSSASDSGRDSSDDSGNESDAGITSSPGEELVGSPAVRRGNDPSCTAFVACIHHRVTEELLWELMLQIGPVVNIRMPTEDKPEESSRTDESNPSQPVHRGFAFVEFFNEESADFACEILSGVPLFGRSLTVRHSWEPRPRHSDEIHVFCRNLHPLVDTVTLFDTFGSCGTVHDVNIVRDSNQNSRGYGFVVFHSAREALRAVRVLNGCPLFQRPLRVEISSRYAHRVPESSRSALSPTRDQDTDRAREALEWARDHELRLHPPMFPPAENASNGTESLPSVRNSREERTPSDHTRKTGRKRGSNGNSPTRRARDAATQQSSSARPPAKRKRTASLDLPQVPPPRSQSRSQSDPRTEPSMSRQHQSHRQPQEHYSSPFPLPPSRSAPLAAAYSHEPRRGLLPPAKRRRPSDPLATSTGWSVDFVPGVPAEPAPAIPDDPRAFAHLHDHRVFSHYRGPPQPADPYEGRFRPLPGPPQATSGFQVPRGPPQAAYPGPGGYQPPPPPPHAQFRVPRGPPVAPYPPGAASGYYSSPPQSFQFMGHQPHRR